MKAKKIKIDLESDFWIYSRITCPFELIKTFFDDRLLESHKENLEEIAFFASRDEIYNKDNPSEVLRYYTIIRSFIRACYLLRNKFQKYKVIGEVYFESGLSQGSLTYEEYKTPFLVFHRAFKVKTLMDYQFFLYEIVHQALIPNPDELSYNIMTPYIYLIKMLDAAQLIREREIEKI
ncbi:hypothetical protein [Elizabethkingia anophelis]|uniref:hypothetical protein n=1 Tax=Elizabethkingia anophelis TaxID=1117645 RepID=UPI00301C8434